jgi:peptidoglycan-associated lipoprotein
LPVAFRLPSCAYSAGFREQIRLFTCNGLIFAVIYRRCPACCRAAADFRKSINYRRRKMKNLLALILVGSMFLAGCAQKQVTTDQAIIDDAPVVEEAAPIVADEVPSEPEVIEVVEKVEVKRAADKIFFGLNSHVLTPASKKALEENALWLQAQPEVRIAIEGHADERGSEKYNLALGKQRAQATRDYLVSLGIAPERITIVSYGKQKATRGAVSENVWSQDRRAEFVTMN